ncbi:CAP domain-containing protein [Patescibacteria group bacterium]|nr:CAP domain-containing protein [Patescibacteria group bacterium]MCL5433205.1 CAP domain-containing protein [Patescibacteria group bacterium]
MKDFFRHLFIPRESNNHRSKILHHKVIIVLILFLFLGQFLTTSLKQNFSQILGVSTNITTQELLLITNQRRQELGLKPLELNEKLSEAASLKAVDMFSKNYWAHNAPDGTTPWVFIKKESYDYLYAGENLARGFSTSDEVVDGWMGSAKHRENMLSKNYQDVGFAVVKGSLLGEDTVLVVEMFGSEKYPSSRAVSRVSNSATNSSLLTEKPKIVKDNQASILFAGVKNFPSIDSSSLSSKLSIFIIILFILVLILDMIIIERRKVARVVGHNLDHVLFFIFILILTVFLTRGLTL